MGVPALAYTFDPSPTEVLRPEAASPRLQSVEDRTAALGAVGIDEMVLEPFSREFANHDARWFAEEVLLGRLGAHAVVVGWDFRFGRARGGGFDELARWLPIPVEQVPAVTEGDEVISSTAIRSALRAGSVEHAAELLGRPHCVAGVVVSGRHLGRTLGFPTANLRNEGTLLPHTGVYAVRVQRASGAWHDGVGNVGTRPTFGERERGLEVHLLDFDGDLYGERLRVEFLARVRDERRFAGPDELVARIHIDIAIARALLQPDR
jgi:riboflavin kinase/FMN adenylyltransferase